MKEKLENRFEKLDCHVGRDNVDIRWDVGIVSVSEWKAPVCSCAGWLESILKP